MDISASAHFNISDLDRIDREQLPEDGGADFNRLIFTRSPYLLQHARNPVDWYPWTEEAFTRAREEEKPIFLSIGYSTCHWCHVMAHESFEDETVAETLRRDYISVKVDREERPDIDNVYMTAAHLMNGSGGWPLTLILTPDKGPFFAATYIPRDPRGGMHGLIDILTKVTEVWQNRRDQAQNAADQMVKAIRSIDAQREEETDLSDGPLRKALGEYRNSFDGRHGGFGRAPKFPAPHNLSLLFRLGQRFSAPDAGRMASATLKSIRTSGTYDQIGYGLHRYAVDAEWRVPHFEKMLYDQALFIMAALDAWQVTGDPHHAETASATTNYLLRDLQHPEGPFYCGEDADSEGSEGTFYLWTTENVRAVLGEEDAELACLYYGIEDPGHFEGKNIPHQPMTPEAFAEKVGEETSTLEEKMESLRLRLFEHRNSRVRPHRDDKIVTAWNGLAIAAVARAGALLQRPEWLSSASMAADFLLKELVSPQGRLLRSWRGEVNATEGFAEDYAFLVHGLTELYMATFDAAWLSGALDWSHRALRLFGSEGDLLDTGKDAEQVLGRGRSLMDGALPAAGSVMAGDLVRLAELTGDVALREHGEKILTRRLSQASQHPTAHAQLLISLDLALGPMQQLAIWCPEGTSAANGYLQEVRTRFLPHLVTLLASKKDTDVLALSCLFDQEKTACDKTTAFLCHDRSCRLPAESPAQLSLELDQQLKRTAMPL